MPEATRRVAAPAAVVAGLAAATTALAARDPHVAGSWGACPSITLFGVYCPGCGGLRAVHDLTMLDVGAAASSNLLLVLAAPFVVFLLVRWTTDAWRGVDRPQGWSARHPEVVLPVFLLVLVAFTVFRNTAAGAWLAP